MKYPKNRLIRSGLAAAMIAIFTAALAGTAIAQGQAKAQLQAQSHRQAHLDGRVDSVLQRMILEEKAGQLTLFTSDLTTTGPVKELRRFEKFELNPGERRVVTFTLHPSDFSFYDFGMSKVVEPGDFHIFADTDSEDLLRETVRIRAD